MRSRRRIRGRLTRLPVVLAGCAALAACGGGEPAEAPRAAATTRTFAMPLPPARGPAARIEPAAEAVVRRWADALRRGDVDRAAALFALPAVVANGTRPVTLDTPGQLRIFHRSLPCGAVVVALAPAAHGFLVATLRLTERPGRGACGRGAGTLARTAFRVERGRIVYWLRLSDPAPAPETPAPHRPASPEQSIA